MEIFTKETTEHWGFMCFSNLTNQSMVPLKLKGSFIPPFKQILFPNVSKNDHLIYKMSLICNNALLLQAFRTKIISRVTEVNVFFLLGTERDSAPWRPFSLCWCPFCSSSSFLAAAYPAAAQKTAPAPHLAPSYATKGAPLPSQRESPHPLRASTFFPMELRFWGVKTLGVWKI